MLGLVKTALHKPYTFIVLAIFICIIGPLAAVRTPTDVFPDIGIPVVAVVWQYTGLAPADMAGRVIYTYERSLSTTVNDIEHIESQSLPGMGIVKIFFQPGVDIRTANAQVTAVSQTVLKQMPPGITHVLSRQTFGCQGLGVQVEGDLALLAAHRGGHGQAGQGAERQADVVLHQVANFCFRKCRTGERQLQDRHRRGAVIEDQRRSNARWHLLEYGL